MNVNDIYLLFKYAIKKNLNGDLSPDEFNRVIGLAQNQYVAYLLGNFQSYQPGRPIARVELGNNSVVRQRLTPVIYGYTLNINAVTGKSPYPADYIQTDSMYSIYGVRRIRFVDQKNLDGVYNSVIDPIASNPIYLLEDDNFQFYPVSTYQAKLHYVKEPPRIIWGYTEDVNRRPVYSAAASQDPVWDNAAIMEIIVRGLSIVGINLQIGAVLQYAEQIKTQGE